MLHLELTRYGTLLRRRGGRLEVVSEGNVTPFAPEDVREIAMTPGVRATTEALALALDCGVQVVLIRRDGSAFARLTSGRAGPSLLRRQQVLFAYHPDAAGWARELVGRKLAGQIRLLQRLDSQGPKGQPEETVRLLALYREKMATLRAGTLEALRPGLMGLEGAASHLYFSQLAMALPASWRFERRSRRPAADPFNAVLNYLYGCLYRTVEGALVRVGLDPGLGILHADQTGRPALAYDWMEPYRVWMDQLAVELCVSGRMARHMLIERNGGVWLDVAGKSVVVPAWYDWMEREVVVGGKRRRRKNHILAEMRAFAQQLLDADYHDRMTRFGRLKGPELDEG